MKNKKNYLSILLSSLLLLCCFTSCKDDAAILDPTWHIGRDQHWQINENGKAVKRAAHVLVENICTVCGATVTELDGEVWISKTNDKNDTVLWYTYDAKGNLVEDFKYEYTYDKDGNRTSKKTYDHGQLSSELTFGILSGESGNIYLKQKITYYADGTKKTEIFDETGWAVKQSMHQADGTAIYEYKITNEFNDSGLISRICWYDGETLIAQTDSEYDDDGILIRENTYRSGTLVKQLFYTNLSGFVYVSKKIIYHEDGTQTVTEYDVHGNVIS